MPAAKSIADLMRIRSYPENRVYLESLNGTLGTALGLKRRTGEDLSGDPAIIVFVPEKINRKWLPTTQRIKPELEGPGGLTCPLDVVAGGKADHEPRVADSGTVLAQRLRGWDERLWCGSQISSARGDTVVYGTLGAFVRRKKGKQNGFLTADHVMINETAWHPWAPGAPGFPGGTRLIGRRQKSVVEVSVGQWYGEFAQEEGNPSAATRVEAVFVSLDPDLPLADIVPQPLVEDGLSRLLPGPFGPVFEIDLQASMTDPERGIIGRPVYHVGRTTGVRKGRIAAFAYEWYDQPGQTRYTDLLIQGEPVPVATGVELSVPFSYKGDSGSVIFTEVNRQRRPIALLWGGYQEQLRGGETQENWSYATQFHRLLKEFDLTLITEFSEVS